MLLLLAAWLACSGEWWFHVAGWPYRTPSLFSPCHCLLKK